MPTTRLNQLGLLAVIFAATFALLVSSASAAQIPKGDYVCSSTFGYAGTVNIKADNKYSVNDGKKGKYSYSRKRKVLNFKTGDHLWGCYR